MTPNVPSNPITILLTAMTNQYTKGSSFTRVSKLINLMLNSRDGITRHCDIKDDSRAHAHITLADNPGSSVYNIEATSKSCSPNPRKKGDKRLQSFSFLNAFTAMQKVPKYRNVSYRWCNRVTIERRLLNQESLPRCPRPTREG